MIILANAFTLSMLPNDETTFTKNTPITVEQAREALEGGFTSAVGHESTAAVLSDMLGMPVSMNRINIKLSEHDTLIVAQYFGPRLPEGATTLPEGARIEFVMVNVIPVQNVINAIQNAVPRGSMSYGEQEAVVDFILHSLKLK